MRYIANQILITFETNKKQQLSKKSFTQVRIRGPRSSGLRNIKYPCMRKSKIDQEFQRFIFFQEKNQACKGVCFNFQKNKYPLWKLFYYVNFIFIIYLIKTSIPIELEIISVQINDRENNLIEDQGILHLSQAQFNKLHLSLADIQLEESPINISGYKQRYQPRTELGAQGADIKQTLNGCVQNLSSYLIIESKQSKEYLKIRKDSMVIFSYSIIVMTKSYFNLLCILVVCSALNVEILKKQALDNLKLFPDYTHHFVFFDEQTLNDIRPLLERWASDTDVKFYLNDCRGNKLPECDNPKQTPLLLIFNKILIRCNAEQTKIEEISDWIESRIVTSPTIVNDEETMNEIISHSPNWFCYATNQTTAEGQAMFYALTKTMPFLNFCVIKNQGYFNSIGLKGGNVTYIKGNATERVEYEYATRLDGWQWFVKNNLLHKIPRSQSLVAQRFAQKQKNINVSLITCDFSFRCEKVWQNVKKLEKQLSSEALGFNFSIAIQDQKESFTFNLYYHLTFDLRKVPAFTHIDLNSDTEAAGKLARYVQYTDKDFTVAKLKDFRERVSRSEVEPFYFSGQIPKKNGFTGKGQQKFIQKLVAKNIREVISASPNHYILLFSTVNIGCTSCETFYKQYKQVAALLVNKDVTFGFFDVNRNEIDFQQITNLPQILLFKKDNKEKPIRMPISHNFQHLRGFLKDYLGEQYFNVDQL